MSRASSAQTDFGSCWDYSLSDGPTLPKKGNLTAVPRLTARPKQENMGKTYRSYIYRFILFIGVYAGLLVLVFFLQLGAATKSSAWLHGLMEKKVAYAESITAQKIMIVAGSSALFGLKAELIEQATGIKTVNLGIMAAFGAEYMLERAKRLAKPGDIIFIPLEYGLYIPKVDFPSYTLADYVVSRDPAYFYEQSLFKKLIYFGVLVHSDIVSRFTQMPAPEVDRQMRKKSADTINQYGDQTANVLGVNDRPDRLAKIHSHVPDDFAQASLKNHGVAAIREFSRWCKDNRIILIATFPNLLSDPHYKTAASKKFFKELIAFYRNIGVPVLGHPYDFMYQQEDLFDSVYHLHADAAEKRTRQLIKMIRQKYPVFFRAK